jgi:kinesin family protein 2/24
VDVNNQNAQVAVRETRYLELVLYMHPHRTKVDLTKYVEEYQFNFDAAFDENTTNE